MREQLKKAISLAKKSQGSVIMFDPNEPESTFAILDLESYEKLLLNPEKPATIVKASDNLTEEDLADKINREISLWKNHESEPPSDQDLAPKKRWQIPKQVKEKAQDIE